MNTLALSPSLYLRMHKDNPVAWRQWGPEALAEAEAQDKPIFLSMGYTGCHWCHVMNRECFSDDAIAAIINENFLPIIVDREDRPDLDLIYQAASQLMGAAGGWPLNIFLTPKGVPFFVTGFMPPTPRQGQEAFPDVLRSVSTQYKERQDQVTHNAAAILQQLEVLYNRDMRAPPENIALDSAALRVGQRFDIFLGGLTGPKKFPSVTLLEVLWRAYLRSGASQYLQLVTTALDYMLMGGLYDHVGGGFFRYTNDDSWLIPHFEKMLNDNAQLIIFLTGIWQYNRNELCRLRVTETVDWMLREMVLGEGFAAGLDADTEGEEGKFYAWTEAEVDAALAGTFSARFKQVYGVTREGTVAGKNILRRQNVNPQPSPADEALLAKQRGMLLASRDKRVRPMRDDKLLTDWNGIAIRALAQAGAVFERPDWIRAAIAAYDYVRKVSGEGDTLYHAYVEGVRGEKGFSDDYAQMARAALDLWEVTGEDRFLSDAKAWTQVLNSQFWSDIHGGYNYTSNEAEPLIVRMRMTHDLPTPSTNATMLTVLTRLALITGDNDFGNRAHGILGVFGEEINRNYMTCGEMLNGFEYFANGLQVIVIGPRNNPRTQELIHTVWGRALPNRLLVSVESSDALPDGHPAKGKEMQNGQPTVYLCQRNVCSPPVTSAVTLSQALTLPQTGQQQQRAG